MRNWRIKLCVGVYFIMMAAGGCASDKPVPLIALAPPPNVDPHVLQLMTDGKRFFDQSRWEAARQQFQSAVQQQADLAEAHYNLGLSMDKMGDQAGAKKHFIEAANLAPGNKVIWNSPPLRRYGNVPDAPAQATSAPMMPGFGGGATPGGGGGSGGGGF